MRTAKNIFLVLIVATLTIFTSCKRQEHDIQPNTDPHSITLGVSMEMVQSKKSTNAEHNYVTTGYIVGLEGALVEGQQDHFEDVDLNDFNIEVRVVGDIKITIWNKDFNGDQLVEEAYYGTEQQLLHTSTQSSVTAKVSLEQGFTIIEAEDGAENMVKSAIINDEAVDLGKFYYTAAHTTEVEIITTSATLKGSHDTELGQGMKYTVKPINGVITLEDLPLFGNAGDGDLGVYTEPVIDLRLINGAKSTTVDKNGYVTAASRDDSRITIYTPITSLLTLRNYEFKINIEDNDNFDFVNIYLKKGKDNFRASYYLSQHNEGKVEVVQTNGDRTYYDFISHAEFFKKYADYTVRIYSDRLMVGNFFYRSGESDDYNETIVIKEFEVNVKDIQPTEPVIDLKQIYGEESAEANFDGSVSIVSKDSKRFNIYNKVDGIKTLSSYSLNTEILEQDNNEHFINIYLKKKGLNGEKVNAIYMLNQDGKSGKIYVNETNENFESFEDLKASKYGDWIVYLRGDSGRFGNFFYRNGSTNQNNSETVLVTKFDISVN